MAFITKPDFELVLPSNAKLDLITNSGDAVWQDAVDTAIQRIRSGANARYNMDTMFAATGTGRDALLVRYTLHMAVYYIYQKVTPDKIPTSILEYYDEAKAWLKGIKNLSENPDWPQRLTPNQQYVQFGGNVKRNNDIL